jgi:predicted HTH domain antitoxin
MTLTLSLPNSISESEAKMLLAVKLFETGKLSIGQAAELAGYSYRAFIEILRVNKVPIASYSPDELETELN